jgi:serine/threonine-protein kinase
MSPEQVMSSRDADAGSDVWSLGVILFRLISGKAPFAGNSLGDLIQNIVHGPLPNLRDVAPDVPEGLEHVVLAALERDRKRRPDVVALARMLAPYAGPNAAPSLERIAILGPALVTSTAPMPALSASSLPRSTGRSRKSLPSSSPSSRTHDTQSERGGGVFGWALLFVALMLTAVFIGRRVVGSRGEAAPSAPVETPTPTPVPAPTEPVTTPAPTSPPVPTAPIATIAIPPAATTPTSPSSDPSTPPTGARSNAGRPSHPAGGRPHPRPSAPPAPKPSASPAPAPAPPPTSDIPPTRE